MPFFTIHNPILPFEFSTFTQKIADRTAAIAPPKEKSPFSFLSKKKPEKEILQPINGAYLTIMGHGMEVIQDRENFVSRNQHISYFPAGAEFIQKIMSGRDKSLIDLREYGGFFNELLFWSKPGRTLIAPKDSIEGRQLLARVMQNEAIQPRTIHTPLRDPTVANIFLSPDFIASNWAPDPTIIDIRNQIMKNSERLEPDPLFTVTLKTTPDNPFPRRPAMRWPHDVIMITRPCLLSHILDFLFTNKIHYQRVYVFSCRRIVPVTQSDFVPSTDFHDFMVSTQVMEHLAFAKQSQQTVLDSRAHEIRHLKEQRDQLTKEIDRLTEKKWAAHDRKDMDSERTFDAQIHQLTMNHSTLRTQLESLQEDFSTEPKIRKLIEELDAAARDWPKKP